MDEHTNIPPAKCHHDKGFVGALGPNSNGCVACALEDTQKQFNDLTARVAKTIAYCRRHEHPGVSLGVHEFVGKVRRILEGE